MLNISCWKPSKFIYHNGKLTTSKNPKEVIVESRFAVKVVAPFYDKYLRLYAKGKFLDLGCGKVPLYAANKDFIDENICLDWAGTFHKNTFLDIEYDLNEVWTKSVIKYREKLSVRLLSCCKKTLTIMLISITI